MLRLSRVHMPRWGVAVAIAIFVAFEAFSVYLYVLDRRVRRELVEHRWRQPTILLSAAHDAPRRIAALYGRDWRVTSPVTLKAMPDYVGNAFIAAEDVRFRHHPGIDPIGIARALITDLRSGSIEQGGSTIDQQIVKTRFLTQERTWRRKIVEMILAVLMDARMPKDEILEVYLNDVYLGHAGGRAVLGVGEASRTYLEKLPTQLRLDEAATLAAIVRAPNRDNPSKRPDIVRARRNAVLQIMNEHGWISDDELRDATARDVRFAGGSLPEAPHPYYLHALRAAMVAAVGERTVDEGGLTVFCEMDPDAQAAAERAASRGATQLRSRFSWIAAEARRDALQVAVLSVDPRNGGIRALVGGSNYDASPFDRTSSMRRQPGSAFKTFAYLAAIASKRATAATLLLDEPVSIEVAGEDEPWRPHNYDERFRGRVSLREAFEKSLNVPTVRLTQQIGLRPVVTAVKRFGFDEQFAPIPALPLGVIEVTMRELTAAYTTFPNLGTRVEPFLVTSISDARGKVLYRHEVERKNVAPADATYVMHTLLRGVVQRGTATRLKRWSLGYVAGKTGTTNDYRDAWFVGYTPDMVSTVWVGFDRGSPLRLSSAEAAIPVWGTYMSAIPHLREELKPPRGVTFRDIDPDSGMLWQDGCPGPWREVFLEGTAPTHHCPRGVIGSIMRKIFFDREHFDEPPAITYDQFRRWAEEVDRERQEVEGALDRLKKIFH